MVTNVSLKMAEISNVEMLVHTYQATQCHDPYNHTVRYVSLLMVKFPGGQPPGCKGIWGSGGTNPYIRNPETKGGEWVCFTPQSFHFRAKITLQSLAGRQSRLDYQAERFGNEKKSLDISSLYNGIAWFSLIVHLNWKAIWNTLILVVNTSWNS
jgi:hypothetical protein